MIARTDDEAEIFRQIDSQREKEALENWRKAGNRGKPPPALMQLDELPECYRNDEPFEVEKIDDLIEGRGQRKRNAVSYNDGLSDDAWALVCTSSFLRLQSTYCILGVGRWRRSGRAQGSCKR